MQNDESLMRAAIEEARLAMGKTHPNPAVGAVISHRGEIVAHGHTSPVGGPHAEVNAIAAFRETGLVPDETTTLAVTLEPCSTVGRTGACTNAICESGIRRVVVGATDPNPAHQGRGYGCLQEAGIDVTAGILEAECEDLNLIFNWFQLTGNPFVAGKIATTIDGCIATRGGLSKWITGDEARRDVHRWRRYFPAIAVGAGTVMVDDPALTAREPGEPEWSPVRFVFDRNLTTFKDRLPSLYTDEYRTRTIVVSMKNKQDLAQRLAEEYGLTVWCLESGMADDGLNDFLQLCREKEIHGIYIEGGAHLLSSFLKQRLLNYLFAYRAPKLLADISGLSPFMGMEPTSMNEAVVLKDVRHGIFGSDQLIRGYVTHPSPGPGKLLK